MACNLPTDCLDEILESLEDDKISLHSCTLVNRHWCKVAVRILWKNVWDFQYNVYYPYQLKRVPLPPSTLSTLIACFPDESKNLLHTNRIFIPAPTSKPPLFNYISFVKILPIDTINQIIVDFLENSPTNNSTSLRLVLRELLKTFMNQIS